MLLVLPWVVQWSALSPHSKKVPGIKPGALCSFHVLPISLGSQVFSGIPWVLRYPQSKDKHVDYELGQTPASLLRHLLGFSDLPG